MQDWDLDERQRNSLEYFVEHAPNWRERAEADGIKRVSTILQRNDHAISLVKENPDKFSTAIDLGCGTGELVMALAELGVSGVGIDYSSKMIELAKEKADRLNLADNAVFDVDSVMDRDFESDKYDLVTAFGFIEYLRPEELLPFFKKCREAVSDGGVFQVGSRNRLFNALSLNQFSMLEINAGTIETILREAIALVEAESFADFVESSLADKSATSVLNEYPQTDVAVAGYQYTPSELIRLMTEAGFKVSGISPVHFHAMVPAVARQNTELHAQFSNTIHNGFRGEHKLIPQASTYILYAE